MAMAKTNFDRFLERELEDPNFRAQFEMANHAWEVALQLVALRKARGLTQQQVAELLDTSQQAIARLENPAYTGHSLGMLRKYVEALGATLDLTVVPNEQATRYHAEGCHKPLLPSDTAKPAKAVSPRTDPA